MPVVMPVMIVVMMMTTTNNDDRIGLRGCRVGKRQSQ